MPINCVDGEVTDGELALWGVSLPPTRIALTCDEVRAVFTGTPLSRGIALQGLTRAQLWKLFPDKSRRKNPWNLLKWAKKIQGAEARRVLAAASWRQLRAAAVFDTEDAQICGAIAWTLGLRG